MVSIGVVAPSAAHAPLLIALGKGYFKDVGLQVDYQQFGQGQAATASLALGRLDVAVTVAGVAFFNEVARGLDTKIVSSMGAFPAEGSPAAIMVRTALVDSGQIKSPADLKGRKLAMGGGKNGSQAYFADTILRRAGLSLNDVEITDLAFPDEVVALKNGSVDAAYLADPFKTEVARQGIGVLLARPEIVGHGGVLTLFAHKFVAEHPDAAKAVMVALLRGARDLQGDGVRSPENLAIMSKYTGLPLDTLKASDPYAYDPDLTPDTETIMGMQQLFLRGGQLTYTQPLAADRLIDGSLAKDAADELGPYKGQ